MRRHYKVMNPRTGYYAAEVFGIKDKAIEAAVRMSLINGEKYQVLSIDYELVTEVEPPSPPLHYSPGHLTWVDLLGDSPTLQKDRYFGKAGQDIKKGDYVEYDIRTQKVRRVRCPECGGKE